MTASKLIPGIGTWTAEYMALKCLRHADSFPATDLILARALSSYKITSLDSISPWRGYAAALIWRDSIEKTKKVV